LDRFSITGQAGEPPDIEHSPLYFPIGSEF
jgi:hypothetical protein